MAKQRISTLFVSLWQSRAMIFCTILRNLACCVSPGTCKNSGGDPTWRKHLPKNFQLTWVCFTCQSAEKKNVPFTQIFTLHLLSHHATYRLGRWPPAKHVKTTVKIIKAGIFTNLPKRRIPSTLLLMAEKRCNQCIHPVHPKNALHPQMLAVLFGPNRPPPKKKKNRFPNTRTSPFNFYPPFFYFFFIVISTPKKRHQRSPPTTIWVSQALQMGQVSPARWSRLAQVKQVLWWQVSPWTMTPLGLETAEFIFPKRLECLPSDRPLGVFKVTISGLKWPVFGWSKFSKSHLEEAGRWFFSWKFSQLVQKVGVLFKIKSHFFPRFDVSGGSPLPKMLPWLKQQLDL